VKPRPAYSDSFIGSALKTFGPGFPGQWATQEWAWDGSTGKGVKVAVIDSGVDAKHPAVGEVAGYVAIELSNPAGSSLSFNTSPHEDAFGHGTACAGIIRALAPDSEIYSVKVLGAGLVGKGAVFLAGLRWAIDHGMTICNLSLGTTRKEFFGELHELADLAYFRNIALVTAANNMPVPSFPSVFSSVISVAAHDLDDPETIYYNATPPVEFGARGINVTVPWLHGSSITTTGNSFAAPHITGIAARVLGKHPDLTVFQLKALLCALAANAKPNDGQPA
jgi:subtilisin family serine protease